MAGSAFPIDVAQLVALFMESLFFGIYLVSFGMCIYVMLIKSHSRRLTCQRVIFLIVAIALFTFAALDVALLLRHVLDAFIWYHGPGGAIAEFSNISYWVNAMKTVTYVAQTSIADGILIYRCYVVYSRNWLVIAPLCLIWLAGMATEGVSCYIEFTLHQSALLNTSQLTPFITSFLTITLALNLIATSMIVYKVYTAEKQARTIFASHSSSALKRANHIIIESGLMYSASVVCFFAVYLASNNAQYGVSDCVVQIIGISFNLIIIRIDQRRTVETVYGATPAPKGVPGATAKSHAGAFRFRRSGAINNALIVDNVAVNVVQESDRDVEMVDLKTYVDGESVAGRKSGNGTKVIVFQA
ncbi:hypothetical protein PHLGIDRAFT_35367 [Phlebiopsis gigantea 11061_1 CR5-6]|uniref:G-protein coupled receptors family 1 profile domain-containing protein n=1 Tax=Phlebiopsis gigantea (strain 11061_1 CR5-6) TaxID=745531 RepID=A0A0C3RZ68_PHLG1|nr:hypothetical protein PHLGIDRAFT_35367 [Phlebiopsis gigantea 11061_1 CR5-6]